MSSSTEKSTHHIPDGMSTTVETLANASHGHHDYHDHSDSSQHPHQHDDSGDIIANSVFAVTGIVVMVFNLIILILYIRRRKMKQNVTQLMLALFIYCFLDGFYLAVVDTLMREYKYVIPSAFCVLANILSSFCRIYLLLLLPLIALERFLTVQIPHMSTKSRQRFALTSLILSLLAALLTCLPLSPHLDVSRRFIDYESTSYSFHRNCLGLINKYNVVQPILALTLSCVCVITVTALYLRMYCIFRSRLGKFTKITSHRRAQIRRATLSVLILSVTFALTTIPTGISSQLTTLCKSVSMGSVCREAGFALWVMSDTLFHAGHLLAPLLFSIYNPKIRHVLVETFCFWRGRALFSTTSHMSATIRPKPSHSSDNQHSAASGIQDSNKGQDVNTAADQGETMVPGQGVITDSI